MASVKIELYCSRYGEVEQILCGGAISCPHASTCNRKSCQLGSSPRLNLHEDDEQEARIRAWRASQNPSSSWPNPI